MNQDKAHPARPARRWSIRDIAVVALIVMGTVLWVVSYKSFSHSRKASGSDSAGSVVEDPTRFPVRVVDISGRGLAGVTVPFEKHRFLWKNRKGMDVYDFTGRGTAQTGEDGTVVLTRGADEHLDIEELGKPGYVPSLGAGVMRPIPPGQHGFPDGYEEFLMLPEGGDPAVLLWERHLEIPAGSHEVSFEVESLSPADPRRVTFSIQPVKDDPKKTGDLVVAISLSFPEGGVAFAVNPLAPVGGYKEQAGTRCSRQPGDPDLLLSGLEYYYHSGSSFGRVEISAHRETDGAVKVDIQGYLNGSGGRNTRLLPEKKR